MYLQERLKKRLMTQLYSQFSNINIERVVCVQFRVLGNVEKINMQYIASGNGRLQPLF